MSRLLCRVAQNGHCCKLLKLSLPGAQNLFFCEVFCGMLIVTTTMNWTSTAQLTCHKPIVLWMVSHILGHFRSVLFWNDVVQIRIGSYFPITKSGIKLPYRPEVSKNLLKYQKDWRTSTHWLTLCPILWVGVGWGNHPNPTVSLAPLP